MSPNEILGWAQTILDMFDLRSFIQVILYIVAAFTIYRLFRSGRE